MREKEGNQCMRFRAVCALDYYVGMVALFFPPERWLSWHCSLGWLYFISSYLILFW